MSIVINGTTLDHDLIWEDEFKFSPKNAIAERSIDGVMIVQTFDKIDGRPITLTGQSDYGWLKRSTDQTLHALEASGTFSFTVVIRGVSYTCRFRREESPALSFDPITNVNSPDADFWYYGTIKLITV